MGAWIMAGVTFREAARKKVLWMALVAGIAFLRGYGDDLAARFEHSTRPAGRNVRVA